MEESFGLAAKADTYHNNGNKDVWSGAKWKELGVGLVNTLLAIDTRLKMLVNVERDRNNLIKLELGMYESEE